MAEAVSELADAAGVSRSTVAMRMGMHHSTLSRCLSGRRSLTLDETARAAAALGLSPTNLILRGQRILSGAVPNGEPVESIQDV